LLLVYEVTLQMLQGSNIAAKIINS